MIPLAACSSSCITLGSWPTSRPFTCRHIVTTAKMIVIDRYQIPTVTVKRRKTRKASHLFDDVSDMQQPLLVHDASVEDAGDGQLTTFHLECHALKGVLKKRVFRPTTVRVNTAMTKTNERTWNFLSAYQMLPRHLADAHHADGVRRRVRRGLLVLLWSLIHKVTRARWRAFTGLGGH